MPLAIEVTRCYNTRERVVVSSNRGSFAATQQPFGKRCRVGKVAMKIQRERLSVREEQEEADCLGVAHLPVISVGRGIGRLHIQTGKGVAGVKRRVLDAFLEKAGMLYSDTAGRPTNPGFVRQTAESHLQETDPILDVLGSLSGEPLSAKDIEMELY